MLGMRSMVNEQMSNIRVSVVWEREAVFAGENVCCLITFTNATIESGKLRSMPPNTQTQKLASSRHLTEPFRHRPASTAIAGSILPLTAVPTRPNHRSTVSLASPRTTPQRYSNVQSENSGEKPRSINRDHKRSLSVLSISDNVVTLNEQIRSPHTPRLKTHARGASFQGVPAISGISTGSLSLTATGTGPKVLTDNSPTRTTAYQSERKPGISTFLSSIPDDISTASSQTKPLSRHSREPSDVLLFNFGYPRSQPTPEQSRSHQRKESQGGSTGQINDISRSSVDFYNTSNNSAETLISEYVTPNITRHPLRPVQTGYASHLVPESNSMNKSETLMIGYVQLLGSFTVDRALVNTSSFDSIKRKGVIGGQGSGGVVGVEMSKKNTGLFGSMGWSNIGTSIGGLLGGQDMSSIREMKGTASAKSIPIISTPQSILFVDLQLMPGESKSYTYCYTLPLGIPPSHKGRALKINYQLVIGTQRAQSNAQHHIVRQVNIPFRVFPSVDSSGEVLGHDLMDPHIFLKDLAQSSRWDDDLPLHPGKTFSKNTTARGSEAASFASYINRLLEQPGKDSRLPLSSPTDQAITGSWESMHAEPVRMKDLIDLAILHGNPVTPKRKTNRFEIQRGGAPVAAIMVTRPAYRLGEIVSTVVDFRESVIPCFALHMSLETCEIVDPGIALRSTASTHRATRKIYAHDSQYTLSARRVAFDFMIPVDATPEFITTGVQLEWKLRFEFVISQDSVRMGHHEGLLERVLDDERGRIYVAMQELPCESFDVAVPIRVYGATNESEDHSKATDYAI